MSQDREFDTYIKGKSGLSDLYAGLPRVEPPGHLDAAILAEAHRAVGARPGGPRKRRWVMPLSMVASLLVAVMIGLQLPQLLKEPEVRQLAREDRVNIVAAASAPQVSAPLQPVVAPEASPPPPDLAPAAPAKRARVYERQSVAAAPVPARPPAPVADRAPDRAGQLDNAGALQESDARAPSAAPAPEGRNGPKAEMRMAASIQAPAPAAEAPRPGVASTEAPAVMAQEAAAPAKVGAAVAHPPAAPAPAPLAAAAPAAAAAPPAETFAAAASLAGETRPSDPREWLARIARLKQQGRADEVRKELAAFHKRYPDYPVPKDLELR